MRQMRTPRRSVPPTDAPCAKVLKAGAAAAWRAQATLPGIRSKSIQARSKALRTRDTQTAPASLPD
jgi:hypothetical protein